MHKRLEKDAVGTADPRDIPYPNASCLAIELWEKGGLGTTAQGLSAHWLVVRSCFHLHHSSVLGFISLYLLFSVLRQFELLFFI